MNLAKTVGFIILNVVLVAGGRGWFDSNCDRPEWYCDNNKIGAEVEHRYDGGFRLYSFCLAGKWCVSAVANKNSNTDLRSVDLVLITIVFNLPRCAIINFPELKTIHGMNAKIKSIETSAFWNLTKLEKINLSYNNIREIQYGVFSGLHIYSLDLSWNEIEFIGKGAFYGLKNLKTLNISRNYLTVFDDSYFSIKNIQENEVFPLEVLLLKQNKLDYIYVKHFPYLKIIDLSHNQVGIIVGEQSFFSRMSVTKLDLTDNLLPELILLPNWTIETLRISFNNLMDPDFLDIGNGKVRYVALDGNPWMCEKYTRLLQYLLKHNIELLKHNEDEKVFFLNEFERENYPTCVVQSDSYDTENPFSDYLSLRDTYKNRSHVECRANYDCQLNMICKSGRCWEPCKQNVCHKSEICLANEHIFFCECPKGKLRNPKMSVSRCYNVECFRDHDCGPFGKCNVEEHICTEMIDE